MFIAALSVNSSDVWINKLQYIHVTAYYSAIKKKKKTIAVHNSMVESQSDYVEQKKPDYKEHAVYDSICTKLQKTKLIHNYRKQISGCFRVVKDTKGNGGGVEGGDHKGA